MGGILKRQKTQALKKKEEITDISLEEVNPQSEHTSSKLPIAIIAVIVLIIIISVIKKKKSKK